MAYVALGDGRQGLADLSSALNLDGNWQARVQQSLLENTQLYDALWIGEGEYQALAQLVPTPTATPVPPTETPTLTPTPSPTQRPRTLPTATATPSPMPTVASVPVLLFPPQEPTPTPSPTSGIPTGAFTLISPGADSGPSFGLTSFEWTWSGPVPEGYGFEVRVWREGMPPLGAHNAVLDNQNGNVEHLGGNSYRLTTNIRDAAGVKQRSGDYLWTVALVQVSPNYADLGQQAPPAVLRFAEPSSGSGSDSSGGGDKGGGGVGID
jgi:hypothetical protein